MTQRTIPRTTPFTATSSWIGVLLLGAGLTQAAPPPGEATSPGPQSASIEFATVDPTLAVFTGGTQKDFSNGVAGWQAPAFASLGMMGLEWTTSTGGSARRDISPDTWSSNPTPGGESTWVSTSYLMANPNNQIYTDKTVSLSGNQIRFAMRHRSLSDESATNRRIYWVAELAPGFAPTYVGAGTSTLLVSDQAGLHPTLILTVTSSAGEASFEGGSALTTALVTGDHRPTLYVTPGDSRDFTMTITVGIVDSDPCSTATANAWAASQSGSYGSVWESFTSCAEPPTWSISTDGEPSEPQSLTFSAPYSAPTLPTTRELDISGLPPGVTWAPASDAGSSLRVTLLAPPDTISGDYPLTLSVQERADTGGVINLARTSTTSGTLRISEPSPAAPEPLTVSLIEPEASARDDSPSASQSSPPIDEVAPRTPIRATDPKVFEIPAMSSVESSPALEEVSVGRDREPRPSTITPVLPEPLGAGAWLGLGAGTLASGGILAAVRRRRRAAKSDKATAVSAIT
jgi:hypothetical protein